MAISKTSAQAEARVAAEEDAAIRQRAARQAANVAVDQPAPELVTMRVTKRGAGKISMGLHVAAVGDAFYEKDEELTGVTMERALELEELGYAEIKD